MILWRCTYRMTVVAGMAVLGALYLADRVATAVLFVGFVLGIAAAPPRNAAVRLAEVHGMRAPSRKALAATLRTGVYHVRYAAHILTWTALGLMTACGALIYLFDETNFLAWVARLGIPSAPDIDPLEWLAVVAALITLIGALTSSLHRPER